MNVSGYRLKGLDMQYITMQYIIINSERSFMMTTVQKSIRLPEEAVKEIEALASVTGRDFSVYCGIINLDNLVKSQNSLTSIS